MRGSLTILYTWISTAVSARIKGHEKRTTGKMIMSTIKKIEQSQEFSDHIKVVEHAAKRDKT
jgi:hypothetical protein